MTVTKSNKRILIIALILLVAAVVGTTWFGRSNSGEQSSPGTPTRQARPLFVDVAPVQRGQIVEHLELSGEVVAGDSVVIAATKEGPIVYCPWREGDTVADGDKLVEIDREVHRAEVQAAEAVLAVARAKLADLKAGARPEEVQKAEANVRRWEATLVEARRSSERQEQLIADDFTSQQSVDQARERMAVAEAELAAAQENLRMLKAGPTQTAIAVQESAVEEAAARLAVARAHLSECVITAPFAGVITAVHVRPGDLAVPRVPLVEMYAPDSVVVRFSVPERFSGDLRQGMKIEAMLDAFPRQFFSGEVVRVYPLLDADMRTRTVEARLQTEAALMPHQFARLTLQLETVENAVIVPGDAVLETPEGEHILFVVEENKAIRRKVVIGIEQDRMVQVTDGLSPGERVVVTGNEMLKNGVPVNIAGGGDNQGTGRQSSGAVQPGVPPGGAWERKPSASRGTPNAPESGR